MLTDKAPDSAKCFPADAYTDYTFEGKEIVTVKRPGSPNQYRSNPKFYTQDQKIDAATLYCVYGDVEEVSKLTNVPASEIRKWRSEPWWIEIQKQIYIEQNERLSSRVSVVLDKTIEQLTDRDRKSTRLNSSH